MMKASTGVLKGLQDRIARLSRNVRRVGTCMVAFVVMNLVLELMRVGLQEIGGWIYWGVLCPLGFVLNCILCLSMNFQTKAFQAPSQGKQPVQRKETMKLAKVAALEDSSVDITPVRVATVLPRTMQPNDA